MTGAEGPSVASQRTADGNGGLQERIMAMILAERLAPGSSLPPEPRLMDTFRASRNSIREALRALQALGIVEIRHGHGTFVGGAGLDSMRASMIFRTRVGPAGQLDRIRDLIEVRELLEVGLIGKCIGRVSAADIATLDGLVGQMADDTRRMDADRAFHQTLYKSSGNPLVLELVRLFWEVYNDLQDTFGETDRDTGEIMRAHGAIVAAVRAGDEPAARAAMQRHFDEIKGRITDAEHRTPGPPMSPPVGAGVGSPVSSPTRHDVAN